MITEIITAEYVQLPIKRPGLFKGRPWTVYYEGATRSNGRRAKRGMVSFKLKRDAVKFVFSICPVMNELPF